MVGPAPSRPPGGPAQCPGGVLDKPSQFAERAVHEWTGQVFQDDQGTILSGQYRLMIRTERTKAREKKKNDTVEPRPYTDEEIEAIDAQYEGRGRGARRPAGGRMWTSAIPSGRW